MDQILNYKSNIGDVFGKRVEGKEKIGSNLSRSLNTVKIANWLPRMDKDIELTAMGQRVIIR